MYTYLALHFKITLLVDNALAKRLDVNNGQGPVSGVCVVFFISRCVKGRVIYESDF